jgi:hypothetical protein
MAHLISDWWEPGRAADLPAFQTEHGSRPPRATVLRAERGIVTKHAGAQEVSVTTGRARKRSPSNSRPPRTTPTARCRLWAPGLERAEVAATGESLPKLAT